MNNNAPLTLYTTRRKPIATRAHQGATLTFVARKSNKDTKRDFRGNNNARTLHRGRNKLRDKKADHNTIEKLFC